MVLDTFVYGSHSTAAEALAEGIPVLGVVGEDLHRRVTLTFASHAAARAGSMRQEREHSLPVPVPPDVLVSSSFAELEHTAAAYSRQVVAARHWCSSTDTHSQGRTHGPTHSQQALFDHPARSAAALEAGCAAAFEAASLASLAEGTGNCTSASAPALPGADRPSDSTPASRYPGFGSYAPGAPLPWRRVVVARP